MKIRLSAIIASAALTLVFLSGCSLLNGTNNQHSTNETESTSSSVSNITDNSTIFVETEASDAESDVGTSGEQSPSNGAEAVNPTGSGADSETSETIATTPTEYPQAEPEINFSDLM